MKGVGYGGQRMLEAAIRQSLGGLQGELEGRKLWSSVGPVSDAYMAATDDICAIMGPIGSGKTTASVKKIALEAARVRPAADGVRRYTIGVWREKYNQLWQATLPSWWKVFPKDFPGSSWTGASPRAAEHIVRWQDAFGLVELKALFLAFGDVADPDDLRGYQFADCWLNEIDTLPEHLFEYLIGRVGRDPPEEMMGRRGRIFGDMNAPDVTGWAYREFVETRRYALYRQPSGLARDAEIPAGLTRDYYLRQVEANRHKPWYVRRMIENIPGFTRGTDMIYDRWDDQRLVAGSTLPVIGELPIIVGIDGGLTPAAVYVQEMPDGAPQVLAEITLDHGGMEELSRAMLALEARLCPDHTHRDFHTVCDPAMRAGEETELGSDRARLARLLKRDVKLGRTNEPTARWDAVRELIERALRAGRPMVDRRCIRLIRGFNQTYHFRKIIGTSERSGAVKGPDSHPHDGLQYAAMEFGHARARLLERDRLAKREAARDRAAQRGAYHPHQGLFGQQR